MELTTLDNLRAFMHANLCREWGELFGLLDGPWIARAVNNWFDDSKNYDRRWNCIRLRRPRVGRVLDMAAGCGTFMLHGLRNGFDVIGVEPEPWKRVYYERKVALSDYPAEFTGRMVGAIGEALPFDDESFDLVTTFQTLEHVANVDQCICEMIRVLRPGGLLYLRAPDYRCFFEPHYRLPFLPVMRRDWAARHLRLLGRPIAGLATLNWTTEHGVIDSISRSGVPVDIVRNREFFIDRKRTEIAAKLPAGVRSAAGFLNWMYQLKRRAGGWIKFGRQERVIDLWITRRADGMMADVDQRRAA